MAVKKYPKSPYELDRMFSTKLAFEHIGPEITVWIGIGLAYGLFTGHNPPFCYAMSQQVIPADFEWKTYYLEVLGIIPANAQEGKLLDAQRFISNTMPVVGQQPPNDYGVNTWDDEVYATEAYLPPLGFRSLGIAPYFSYL